MLQFELLDETFDLNKTKMYHLSIQADLDGFLFAILEPASGKFLGLKQYSFRDILSEDDLYVQTEKVLREDPLLKNEYSSVACLYPDPRSTLIPAALFEKDQLKSYFEFNHVLKDLDELHYNYLKQPDAYLVYPVHHEIANLYLSKWVNATFYHPVAPLAAEVLQAGSGTAVNVHFYGMHFDILVTEDRKLRMHNNFTYRSEEDMLYFILFVFDKLGLDQENIPVHVSGNLDKFSDRPALLRSYFNKLHFRAAPAGFQYPPVFDRIQEHIYLSVFKAYHCVS